MARFGCAGEVLIADLSLRSVTETSTKDHASLSLVVRDGKSMANPS
jgi:hypothetical protein